MSSKSSGVPADPEWATARPYYSEERVWYFHGTAELYHREPDGRSTVEYLTCKHRHTDPDKAKECGRRLGERTARARNKAARL